MYSYLLTYDALAFHAYLETVIEANSVSNKTGRTKVHQSPWLYTDAANMIFAAAKARCYIKERTTKGRNGKGNEGRPVDVDFAEDEDALDALDELQGLSGRKKVKEGNRKKEGKGWLPDDIEPVLEEHPKWGLLADILMEIEDEMIKRPMPICELFVNSSYPPPPAIPSRFRYPAHIRQQY